MHLTLQTFDGFPAVEAFVWFSGILQLVAAEQMVSREAIPIDIFYSFID